MSWRAGIGRGLWAAVAVAVACLAGCGSQGSAEAGPNAGGESAANGSARVSTTVAVSADPQDGRRAERAVALQLSRALLDNRENVTTKATPAQVRTAARRIGVRCRRVGSELYGCAVHLGEGFAEQCSVRLSDGRATGLRCGGGPTAPIVRDRFVRCSTLGHEARVADPAGDTVRTLLRPRPPKRVPQADLRAVAVTRTRRALCVDFTLARRPGRLQLQFEAMHPGRFTGERLWVTIELGAGDARVRAENHGDLAAQVGTHGNDASILLDATTLPSGLQYLFAGPFRYRARAGTPPVPGQPVIQGDANDTAPQNDGLALYR